MSMKVSENFAVGVGCIHLLIDNSDSIFLFVMVNRISYMSAHVLLNLLNRLRKGDKYRACRAFYLFFATSLINSE